MGKRDPEQMAQTEREVFRWLAIILGLYALWCAGIMFAWYEGWLR